MKIYRRGKNWWVDFQIDGSVRVRESLKTSDEKHARLLANRRYEEAWRRSQLGAKPRKTFKEAADRYLHERKGLASYTNYCNYLQVWLDAFDRKRIVYLDQVTPDVVTEICDSLMETPKKWGGGQRSNADVNRHIQFLRGVMNSAYRVYLWVDGTCPIYRLLSGETRRNRALTPSEVLALARALPQPFGDMALFATFTGLRRANVVGLMWGSLDFGRRLLALPGEVMKNGQPLTIPLNQSAVEVLLRQERVSEYVFTNKGKPVERVEPDVWRNALHATGLKDVRWHDLRHTWATTVRMAGVSLADLQELGGWKDMKTVLRYAHTNVDHLANKAAVIDSAFSRIDGTSAVQVGCGGRI